ncbi:hypothetical protein D9611_006563 [Ephemerocybe angulata]|uniref:Nephrocystin 3-like N-terminal domain-containing protein n=1 Tax=Ephemerocybe angulata TaxID=980116 RepID=A0A8H5C8I0_9AGAR|nr:hypothetical protein D9611_006563 [Tulosesus angulatus]
MATRNSNIAKPSSNSLVLFNWFWASTTTVAVDCIDFSERGSAIVGALASNGSVTGRPQVASLLYLLFSEMSTPAAEGIQALSGLSLSSSGNEARSNETQQGSVNLFQDSQHLSIGTMTTTVVSGNCTYNVTVVKQETSGTLPQEAPEITPQDIVAWLKAPDFLPIYEKALRQRLYNTGTWFIESEEFRQLVEGQGVIVWGTGMPGTGKTVLSSFSLQYLRQIFQGHEDVAVVGAYIRYTEQPPLRDIFAGLLSQLVKNHTCAYHYMKHVYTSGNQNNDLPEIDMVRAFQEVVRLLSKVFLIIDGLDEADNAVKDGLLKLIPWLGCNVLITSRPLDLYAHHLPHALYVSIQAHTEDIDHFVEETIKSNSRLKAILRGKTALKEQLKLCVRETSKGMFLVARLQMDGVLEKGRSVSTLLKALDQLPSGVDEMYEHTLERINAQPDEDVSIAHRVFIWLLYSTRNLSLLELQHALAVSFEDEAYDPIDIIPGSMILSMCGGFVTVEEKGEKEGESDEYGNRSYLRFIHYTTHDFLKTVVFFKFPSPHSYLAVTCLIYLRQLGGKLQEWEREEDEDPALGLYFESNPFLSYADTNWGKHAAKSKDNGPLHPFIQTFLTGCARHDGLYNHKFAGEETSNGPSFRATPLHLAAMYGLVDVINAKVLPYAPLPQEFGGETPFHYAAQFNQPLALKALRGQYTGVNAVSEGGKTALMLAQKHGHEECVQTLVSTRVNADRLARSAREWHREAESKYQHALEPQWDEALETKKEPDIVGRKQGLRENEANLGRLERRAREAEAREMKAREAEAREMRVREAMARAMKHQHKRTAEEAELNRQDEEIKPQWQNTAGSESPSMSSSKASPALHSDRRQPQAWGPSIPAPAPSQAPQQRYDVNTPSVAVEVNDLEPDEQWKADLRNRIAHDQEGMKATALRQYEDGVRLYPRSKKSLEAEYTTVLRDIEAVAREQFDQALMRERMEKRFRAGLEIPPFWMNMLQNKQAALFAGFQREKMAKDGEGEEIQGPPTEPTIPQGSGNNRSIPTALYELPPLPVELPPPPTSAPPEEVWVPNFPPMSTSRRGGKTLNPTSPRNLDRGDPTRTSAWKARPWGSRSLQQSQSQPQDDDDESGVPLSKTPPRASARLSPWSAGGGGEGQGRSMSAARLTSVESPPAMSKKRTPRSPSNFPVADSAGPLPAWQTWNLTPEKGSSTTSWSPNLNLKYTSASSLTSRHPALKPITKETKTPETPDVEDWQSKQDEYVRQQQEEFRQEQERQAMPDVQRKAGVEG